MPFTKHVGQNVSTQQKVVVMFRQIPEDPEFCLVVDTDGLDENMHTDLMNEVEGPMAQQQVDFYKHADNHFFRDGSKILQRLHQSGKLIRIETSKIMMTPDNKTNILLDTLNKQLGALEANPNMDENQFNQQMNTSTDAVTIGDEVKPATVSKSNANDGVLDDFKLAKGFISQANGMETEAKRLREQAYDLIPKRKLTGMLKKEDAVT